jgi:hypothetical protein
LSPNLKGSTQLDLEITSQSNPILNLPLLEFSSSKKDALEIELSISRNEMTGGANKKTEKIKIKM